MFPNCISLDVDVSSSKRNLSFKNALQRICFDGITFRDSNSEKTYYFFGLSENQSNCLKTNEKICYFFHFGHNFYQTNQLIRDIFNYSIGKYPNVSKRCEKIGKVCDSRSFLTDPVRVLHRWLRFQSIHHGLSIFLLISNISV